MLKLSTHFPEPSASHADLRPHSCPRSCSCQATPTCATRRPNQRRKRCSAGDELLRRTSTRRLALLGRPLRRQFRRVLYIAMDTEGDQNLRQGSARGGRDLDTAALHFGHTIPRVPAATPPVDDTEQFNPRRNARASPRTLCGLSSHRTRAAHASPSWCSDQYHSDRSSLL
jgi:hypothetical protein